MDCTLQRKATRKHSKMQKYLIDERVGVLFPYRSCDVLLAELVVLLTNTPISELRVIAVVAKRVDAMMLLRIVWTAKTPFFKGS